MRHRLDLPFSQAADHFIALSLNSQSRSAVTMKNISFHLFSPLWSGRSGFGYLSLSLEEARMGAEKTRAL